MAVGSVWGIRPTRPIGYGIDNLHTAPPLNSLHTTGKVIEMSISWTKDLQIRRKGGVMITISSEPRNGNPEFVKIAKTYGIIYNDEYEHDGTHWTQLPQAL